MYDKNVLHLNITGEPGVGQTNVAHLLYEMFPYPQSIWIPRWTDRPRRPGERADTQYLFFESRFKLLQLAGEFLILDTIHENMVRKTPRVYAIPRPLYWPSAVRETRFYLSNFGRYSGQVKERFAPHMINILLLASDVVRETRLKRKSRKQNLNLTEKILWDYWWDEKNFDLVVQNEGTVEECAEKIIKLVGLDLIKRSP